MADAELSFEYFPEHYRWPHGILLALSSASWGGGEIDEIHRTGTRLRARIGDDRAWFEEWRRTAERVERTGRERTSSMWDWLEDALEPRTSS